MTTPKKPHDCSSMEEVRSGIDALDKKLVQLFKERAAFIDRATELKQGNGWPARIPERVEEVVVNARREAEVQGLDPDLIEKLWRQVIDWSIDREETGLGRK
ncbi:chorismate mutase [Cognatishimia activa]|uniref:chorismate mutase n=1 Tax=Cognatishimia activa TaxID=1715691 RepID=UPI00222F4B8B|nr:chorismate mutase [Cognatishimia activa]UZD89656.1 chorismate mutase [Cognatishimia activa]